MKRAWMLGAASAIVFAMGCSANKPELTEDFSDLQAADGKSDTISTSRLKVVGSLDYNQTASVRYDGKTKYYAYKFGGAKGDQVTIDVGSKDGDAYAWLTDNLGKVIAKNDDYGTGTNSHIEATLPGNKNPDLITYYIVFTEYYGHAATFSVNLQSKKVDFFACKTDSDCVAEPEGGCCPHGYKVAVNSSEVSQWQASVQCTVVPRPLCPLYLVNDTRVAECSNTTHKCEMVDISAIQCGGFILNHHQCPAGYDCSLPVSKPDLPGSCVATPTCVDTQLCIKGSHWDSTACKCVPGQLCGGIAGIACPAGQNCVDNPNDNCDPANGGADCGGICVDAPATFCGGIANIQCPGGQKCVDNPNDNCDPANGGADCGGMCVACVQNVLCTTTSHWSQYRCQCVPNFCVDNILCANGYQWSAQDCTCVPATK